MVDRGDDTPLRFRNRAVKNEFYWDSNRYPCQTPPWGQLNAIDLNTGEFRWRSVLGEFDELTKLGSLRPARRISGGARVYDS